MPTQSASLAARSAVMEYYAGQRREMTIIMVLSLSSAAVALGLLVVAGSAAAQAFLMVVGLGGVLRSVAAVATMARNRWSFYALSLALQTLQHTAAVSGEKQRLQMALSKFTAARYGAALLAAIALVGLLSSDRDWLHGVAAGLLLAAAVQVMTDLVAERRAHAYFARLSPGASEVGQQWDAQFSA